MQVVFVSSEVAPFAKTGGLADVSGALPKAIAARGHDVRVVMPLYRCVREGGHGLTDTGRSVSVPIVGRHVPGGILEGTLPGADVPVHCIRNDAYYDREGLYVDPATGRDYEDNCERFAFFCRAAVEAMKALHLRPDVLHCNDWQSALIPVYLRTLYAKEPALSEAATLFTVHNLGYQGLFPHSDMKLTGLDWELFNWQQLEFYGKLNVLKGGLVFADILNTVSHRYAREIQTEEFGHGLEGVLAERAPELHGVVNGIDYAVWDPETDPLIPARYAAGDLSGKAVCKRELRRAQGLPEREGTPLIGMISRLAAQKGFDILERALEDLMALDLQMVLLGTGDRKYHEVFAAAAERWPDKLVVNLAFDNQLAHQIEAGCDLFLMPSRYEPCGLNQLYSLKYGTVPVGRATGGLVDTVADPDASREPTGFLFDDYQADALVRAVGRALEAYRRPDEWARIVAAGMAQDWSWGRSAGEYVELYEKAIAARRKRRAAPGS